MVRPVTHARLTRRACLLLPLGLAGCNRDRKKVIAVIPKATSHLFWQSVQAGALAAGKEFDVEVVWNGPASETEYSRQIQIMDSMIARHVDGIAVAASERKALGQVLDRAAAANIPVTVFDSGVESTNYLTFVATDNYEAGVMGAQTLGKLLDGKGTAALLMHMPGSSSTMDRERGFRNALAKEFPGIRIVAEQFGQSDRAKALAASENILAAHPNLNGIFCSSEPSAAGASQALKARGVVGKVKLVGVDSSDAMLEDMRKGVIQALIVQDPFGLGREAVRTLVDKLNGKTPPKQIDLPARLVQAADLDKPEVQQLLHPDVNKYLKS